MVDHRRDRMPTTKNKDGATSTTGNRDGALTTNNGDGITATTDKVDGDETTTTTNTQKWRWNVNY